jgi:beta-galactosidase/beta-glucuronidase
MKVATLDFEIIRATPAVAEFLVHVRIDSPVMGYEVVGRAVGPRCPGVSTVEVAYAMTMRGASDTTATLRCMIPEPNMWTPEMPFTYAVTVGLFVNGEFVDTGNGLLALRRQ